MSGFGRREMVGEGGGKGRGKSGARGINADSREQRYRFNGS